MTRKQWLLLTAGAIVLGGGGFGACALSTTADGEAAGLHVSSHDVPATVDPGGDPEIRMPDAGPRFDGVPVPDEDVPPNARHDALELADTARACGESRPCPVGQRCCYPVATCVPADCIGCCEALMNPPVEAPRVIPDGPPPPPE
jgi:hypothetical protein